MTEEQAYNESEKFFAECDEYEQQHEAHQNFLEQENFYVYNNTFFERENSNEQ